MNKYDIEKIIAESCSSISRDNLNRYLKNHFPHEYEFILTSTEFLDKFDIPGNKNKRISIFERLYCIFNDMTDRPKCKNCGVEYVCGFNIQTNEYKKWCCPKCQASDTDCLRKSTNTKIELYGSATYNGNDKAKKTRLERYGSYHGSDFVKKIKETKLLNHGNENYVNVEKAKQTKLTIYGSETYCNHEKCVETKTLRYGDPNYNNRDKFKVTVHTFDTCKIEAINNKRASTNITKYGFAHPMQNETIKNKAQDTTENKYGVRSLLMTSEIHEKSIISIKEKSWNFLSLSKDYIPLFTKDDYINNREDHRVWDWMHSCGNVFKSTYDNGMHCRCPKCYPNNNLGISKMEMEIANYIRSITTYAVYNHTDINKNVISCGEIDIWIPELKLGIEFDGLYYHSESMGKNKTYHLNKTEECLSKGIRLIHIFEDEYVNNKRLVLSKIKHSIINTKRRIFARKCTIREIDSKQKDMFVEKYHIQGRDISRINLGLFYGRHLVAVMTFVKSRFNDNYEYELSRYCTVSNFVIVGGASKLLKYFERIYSPKSLITFADRRWSLGNMYNKIGFKLTNISAPNYFYVKRGHRYSRLQFQKHMLKDKLEIYDGNLTESQNMFNNGYDRIFDCGNYVFVKEYS